MCKKIRAAPCTYIIFIKLWTERIAHILFYGVKLPDLDSTGGAEGTWENPPPCKMGTFFFLMALTLTEPSLNNFQF